MITTPSNAEYAAFLGVDVGDLGDYTEESLAQGVDLLWLATGMTVDPTGEQELRIMKRGIMAAAEGMEAALGYRSVITSPFSSETIGSYSYSKMVSYIRTGIPTGMTWFDLAVTLFATSDDIKNTAVSLFDRHDGLLFHPEVGLLGPADLSLRGLSADMDIYHVD